MSNYDLLTEDFRQYRARKKTDPWGGPAPADVELYSPKVDAGNVAGLVELLEQRLGPRDHATRQIRAVVEWLNDPAQHCPADSAVEDR